LELSILLPQPPKCWDYRCVPSCPAAAATATASLRVKAWEFIEIEEK
jgi:hypothetical protein